MKNLRNWGEAFCTGDYDQEMLDFIEENYEVDKETNGWKTFEPYLGYSSEDNDFYIANNFYEALMTILTKEEFKRRIGMIVEEEKVVDKTVFNKTFSKSDLVDGMVVEIREPFEEVSLYLVKGDRLLSKKGHNLLEEYQEDLTLAEGVAGWDIVKVYAVNNFRSLTLENLDKNLIWERKTQSQLKLEALQQKMESLQEEINILQKSIEAGE